MRHLLMKMFIYAIKWTSLFHRRWVLKPMAKCWFELSRSLKFLNYIWNSNSHNFLSSNIFFLTSKSCVSVMLCELLVSFNSHFPNMISESLLLNLWCLFIYFHSIHGMKQEKRKKIPKGRGERKEGHSLSVSRCLIVVRSWPKTQRQYFSKSRMR